MELEIERKWLVPAERLETVQRQTFRNGFSDISQAYLSSEVRVRLKDNKAILCIKRRQSELTVKEFEYEIPVEDAEQLMEGLSVIKKLRNNLPDEFTLDTFKDKLKGLVLVEKEFPSEDEAISAVLPDWLDGCPEVTGDPTYINANLGDKLFVEGVGITSELNIVTGDEEEVEIDEFIIR